MSAIQMIAVGRKLSNIYSELSLPICRKYGINQTCFDILLFFANNPSYCTARDICAIRGIKSGIASVAVETLIGGGYLLRTEDPEDKAAGVVADGQKMQKYFTETLRQGITEEEFAAFQSLTDKLEANIASFGGKEKTLC